MNSRVVAFLTCGEHNVGAQGGGKWNGVCSLGRVSPSLGYNGATSRPGD